VNLQIIYVGRHTGSGGWDFEKLVSNFIGSDVDTSVTLTMVTVMLGLERKKV
jgi:hypothetical protein